MLADPRGIAYTVVVEERVPSEMINLAIDAARCTACRACELACSFSKEGFFSPSLSRIRIVQTQLGVHLPAVCGHCIDAPCIPACPTGAVYREGRVAMVRIKADDCIACGQCSQACPYGAVALSPGTGVALVCDLCKGLPACVENCLHGALQFAGVH